MRKKPISIPVVGGTTTLGEMATRMFEELLALAVVDPEYKKCSGVFHRNGLPYTMTLEIGVSRDCREVPD